ncbi:hypothetical protein QVD17_11471 [Tagetes erecta]|uniref:Uncharacterized protein n=1 Tax=Tagetes erecta TaxID=13708 RepID=A0AAD8L0R1_TARER|nr:hypothetical protein QVD17_11471 [Tagetes erecta]
MNTTVYDPTPPPTTIIHHSTTTSATSSPPPTTIIHPRNHHSTTTITTATSSPPPPPSTIIHYRNHHSTTATSASPSPSTTIIHRRNHHSTTTTTAATSSSPSPSSLSDFELVSIKPPCYTSLRDILPSPATVVRSPKTPHSGADLGFEILIRDHLVKQAAWAYLQPMSTSPELDESTVIRRLWTQFSGALIRFISTAFDHLLRLIQV